MNSKYYHHGCVIKLIDSFCRLTVYSKDNEPLLNVLFLGFRFSKLKSKSSWIIILLLGFLSCEKDDICVPTTPTTPRLILHTFSRDDLTKPVRPPDFLVRPIGIELALPMNDTHNLFLPLRTNQSFTEFEFIINHEQDDENIDTLRINYRVEDQYVNRSCGFISNFILNDPPYEIINSGEDWIMEIKTLKNSIVDEQSAHLHLIF